MLQGLAMSLAECCTGGVLSQLSHDGEMAQTGNAQSGNAGYLGTWSESSACRGEGSCPEPGIFGGGGELHVSPCSRSGDE